VVSESILKISRPLERIIFPVIFGVTKWRGVPEKKLEEGWKMMFLPDGEIQKKSKHDYERRWR
jgi:hypothetical protein